MNKRYYWLRLKKDFFTDKRIKKLRKIAGGDTYTIIYLKMQLLSLQDEGILYYDELEDTFEEEIALQIDEEIEDTKITIGFLLSSGLMIKLDDKRYELVETKKCIGSETPNAEKMRNLRAKRDEISNKSVTMLQDVTKCNIEKEIEKDKEKDKKEIIKEKKYFDNPKINEIFLEFLDVRKKLKAVNSDRAIKSLINTLERYDDDTKYKMIDKSIRNSWKDVYELKDKTLPEWFDKKQDDDTSQIEKEEMEKIVEELEKW